MEPFSRRPVDRSSHRPLAGTPGRPANFRRPVTPHPHPQPTPQPVAPTHASTLRPPLVSGPAMDVRPAVGSASSAFQPPQPRPATPTAPASTPVAQPPASNRQLAATPPPHPVPTHHARHQQTPYTSSDEHIAAPKEPHPTGHAGMVGLIIFVVLAVLCFAPWLPGKAWHDAPGSSQSYSLGDQNIGCVTDLGPLKTTTAYDNKLGFPVVYSYATTDTIHATCGNKVGHATGGHQSQFNPLGALVDLSIPLAVSVAAAKLWRKLRAPHPHHAR
ncbi:MAG TPA: hypothetical protein VLF69_02745 [Candidatus Saccharimonadales bacterium]|nr:hypothetical protein [Candidatus Saccharimonadales bacterium]